MEIQKKDNKFLSLVFIFLSLVILVFFTKYEYSSMQANLDSKSTLNSTKNTLSGSLTQLNNIKIKILKNSNEKDIKEIKKYNVGLNEDELISFFYGYIDSKKADSLIWIEKISISNPKVNELGFKESTITLSLYNVNEELMIWFIRYILSENSKYKFFIDTLSYPIESSTDVYKLTLPIKVFYK